jgi:hypothetical protein
MTTGGKMRLNAKVGIATAVSALAVTGPAVAQACTNPGQGQPQAQHAAKSSGQGAKFDRGFRHHNRGFGRSDTGALLSWSATQTGTNTYTGSITVSEPAFTSHWAAKHDSGAQPTQVTYTFTNAKVLFGQGANPPAAGDLVKVIGAGFAGHCKGQSSGTTGTSTATVRALIIRQAPASSSSST